MKVQRRTMNATHDDLSDDDYLAIYHELRGYDPESGSFAVSLRKFAEMLDSEMTHAVWSKFDGGRMGLTRHMKSALRKGVGLPPLPLTVQEALYDVDEDAEVLVVGDDEIDQVILTSSRQDLLDKLSGRQAAPQRERKPYVRPAVEPEYDERRESLGVSWRDVIEAGLASLEKGESEATK